MCSLCAILPAKAVREMTYTVSILPSRVKTETLL